MSSKADLHIHTTCSDGRMAPEDVVMVAAARNLKACSITDHDTIEGYVQAKKRADELEIELIPGVEITSAFEDREAHILAYYFDVESPQLNKMLIRQKVSRRERIKGIINTLISNGIDIDYDEVRAVANGANIGRPHVANVLVRKGYVGNYFEAFSRYLSSDRLGEIEQSYPSYQDVIKIVKEAGGACILAHPGKLYSQQELQLFISSGIDGLECIHPSHNFTLQKMLTELVTKNALLLTGGSDFHGTVDRAYVHLGVVTVAEKHVDKMKRMTDQRKKIIDIK